MDINNLKPPEKTGKTSVNHAYILVILATLTKDSQLCIFRITLQHKVGIVTVGLNSNNIRINLFNFILK